jgi:hypothetical protein
VVSVRNADCTALDVLIGNSVLRTQTSTQHVLPRSNYLTIDGEMPTGSNIELDIDCPYVGRDFPVRDSGAPTPVTLAFPWPSAFLTSATICVTELVLEISGPLGNFDTYAGLKPNHHPNAGIYIYPGTGDEGPITFPAPIRTLGDVLLYGSLKTFDFGGEQESCALLHHFTIPLSRQSNQGVLLRAASNYKAKRKIRVVVNGFDFSPFKGRRRHRWFVRWHELNPC